MLTFEGHVLRLGGRTYEARGLKLSGTREDWTNSAPKYRAELLTDDGEHLALLEHPDPVVVLSQARELSRESGLPLEPGWGLSSAAPPSEAHPFTGAFSIKGEVRPAQRAAGATALGSALFVLCFFLKIAEARYNIGSASLWLSLILPLPAISWGLLVGSALLGLRAFVEYSSKTGLRYFQRCFGFVVRTRFVPAGDVASVHAIAPDGGSPIHLLVETTRGPEAFPMAGEPVHQAVRAFQGSHSRTDQPAPDPEAIENIGVPEIIKTGHSIEG